MELILSRGPTGVPTSPRMDPRLRAEARVRSTEIFLSHGSEHDGYVAAHPHAAHRSPPITSAPTTTANCGTITNTVKLTDPSSSDTDTLGKSSTADVIVTCPAVTFCQLFIASNSTALPSRAAATFGSTTSSNPRACPTRGRHSS